ncbi:hypothetical protein RISK_004950 [Rhodopirellula islandica]|uniref:Uncharacterized protein n=1 Tax=Rhodopirellula islandica TaxID=595434 RepID=A0A0J1B834_RHOIS|nr:hypothetical protein [Rhodopirellula islandica]KLU02980.1 hypothetical protein RISK_004950 [Rhodopirellula islandica]
MGVPFVARTLHSVSGSTTDVFRLVSQCFCMHVVQLTELASVLSYHGPAMLLQRSPISPEAIAGYWTASRNRLDLWHQVMARFNRVKATGDFYRMRCWWTEHMGVLEEILASEALTRVVAAIGDGIDRRNGTDECSPITQAIHLSHLEARNRVQWAILDRRGCSVTDAVRLNRLRRVTERWIDVLVGSIAAHDSELTRYGMDLTRTQSHANAARECSTAPTHETVAWLTRAAMKEGFQKHVAEQPSLPAANQAVADSVMMMMRADLFDSVGVLKSLWMHRIESKVEQTDQMIAEFLRPDVNESTTVNAYEQMHATAMAHWFR